MSEITFDPNAPPARPAIRADASRIRTQPTLHKTPAKILAMKTHGLARHGLTPHGKAKG